MIKKNNMGKIIFQGKCVNKGIVEGEITSNKYNILIIDENGKKNIVVPATVKIKAYICDSGKRVEL